MRKEPLELPFAQSSAFRCLAACLNPQFQPRVRNARWSCEFNTVEHDSQLTDSTRW